MKIYRTLSVKGSVYITGKREAANFNSKIENINNVVQVAGTYDYIILLMDDGTVYSLGDNFNGAMGIGVVDNIVYDKPVKLSSLNNIIQIVVTDIGHSVFLDLSGNVYTTGSKDPAILGHDITIPGQPEKVESITDVIHVSAVFSVTTCVTRSGDVYEFGIAETPHVRLMHCTI